MRNPAEETFCHRTLLLYRTAGPKYLTLLCHFIYFACYLYNRNLLVMILYFFVAMPDIGRDSTSQGWKSGKRRTGRRTF